MDIPGLNDCDASCISRPATRLATRGRIRRLNALLGGACGHEPLVHGIPQPTNLEMRCIFDSMTAGVRDLFASADADPAAIAATMQSGAEAGVAPGGECGPA